MKAFPSFSAYELPQPTRERQARSGFDPLKWLWEKLSTIVNSHLPLVDLDGDKFSSKLLVVVLPEKLQAWFELFTIVAREDFRLGGLLN